MLLISMIVMLCYAHPSEKRIDWNESPKKYDCPRGYYQEEGHCIPCFVGTISKEINSQSCTPCPPGTFAPRHGLSICVGCPKNTHNKDYGQQYCSPCPIGMEAKTPGSIECTKIQK